MMKFLRILLVTSFFAVSPQKSEASSELFNATLAAAAASSSPGGDPITVFINALGPSGTGTAIAIATWQILKRVAPPVWNAIKGCAQGCRERSAPPPYANFIHAHLSENPAEDVLSLYLHLLNTANTEFQDTPGFSYAIGANDIRYETPRTIITCEYIENGDHGFPAALPPHLEAKGMKKITGYMQSLLSPYGSKDVAKLLQELNGLYQTGKVYLSIDTEDDGKFYTFRAYIPTAPSDDHEVPSESYVIVTTKMKRPQAAAPLDIVVDGAVPKLAAHAAIRPLEIIVDDGEDHHPHALMVESSSLSEEDEGEDSKASAVSPSQYQGPPPSRRQSVDGLDDFSE